VVNNGWKERDMVRFDHMQTYMNMAGLLMLHAKNGSQKDQISKVDYID
jgi:hypothetical protein